MFTIKMPFSLLVIICLALIGVTIVDKCNTNNTFKENEILELKLKLKDKTIDSLSNQTIFMDELLDSLEGELNK